MHLSETGCEGVDRIPSVQIKTKWRAFRNIVMNRRVSNNA